MIRKFTTLLAASAFALVSLAPATASAQRWRHDPYYGGHDAYGCVDDNNYGCERDRDRRAARRGGYDGYGYGYGNDDYYRRNECYDRYGRYRCRDRDDDDDDEVAAAVIGLALCAVLGAAVANSGNRRDDGYQNCTRQERRWDRQRQRYVYVDVPC